MALYDSTERRLERARERAQKQKRVASIVAITLLALALLVVRASAPRAPQLFVTWPSPQKFGARALPDGATILLRGSQPMTVSVTNAERWMVGARSGDTVHQSRLANKINWTATRPSETLSLSCRAASSGLARVFSWMWPTRALTLKGTTGAGNGGARQRIIPENGASIWLSSQILATSEADWDERALPLLEAAHRELNKDAATKLAPWKMARSFTGKTLANDKGTYASLVTSDVTRDLTRAANLIARLSPSTSIKWMARLDLDPPQGILRLAFDGETAIGARAGWVFKAGDKNATPVIDWQDAPNAIADAVPDGVPIAPQTSP